MPVERLSKFGNFLRDFGGGLNPQVAAANRQEEELIAREEQSGRDRQEKIGLLLATSLQKLDPNDPRNEQTITEITGTLDKMGMGDLAPIRGQATAAKPERFITLQSPKGDERKSLRMDDSRADELTNKGWTIAATRQEQGGPGSFEKKEGEKRTKEEIALRQNVSAIEGLKGIVSSDNYVGGVTGGMIQGIASGAAQVRQLFGDDRVTDDNGNPQYDLSALSDNAMGAIRKMAGQSAEKEAAIKELAFIHAKSLDPNGRISDKDVAAAERMIGDNADKMVSHKLFTAMQKRLVKNANIALHTRWKASQNALPAGQRTKFKPFTIHGILADSESGNAPVRTDLDDIADDLYNELTGKQ